MRLTVRDIFNSRIPDHVNACGDVHRERVVSWLNEAQEILASRGRWFGMVAKASGDAITAGTVNYYCKALTGTNAGKWWKDSDQTWAVAETANAMTHQADGNWTITLTTSPFTEDVLYVEYAKESGDLHVAAAGRLLRGGRVIEVAGPIISPMG